MRAIDKCGAGDKRALQQVQRGTDTRIPVALVKQPTGEPLDPATLEGLAVRIENEGGALSAEPPYTLEGGQLIVEVTKEISERLGVGVYTLKATGRLADPSYEDGYHDYTIIVELCRVVRDAVLYTPTTVTANVLAGLKGKDGLTNYQLAVKHGYQGTEEQFAKDIIPKSNYERAKELQGFQGTEEEYLDSLHGAPGKDLYQAAVERGYNGSFDDFLEKQKGAPGDPGKSNYELAQEDGFIGTLTAYLASLKGADGKNAYELAQEAQNFTGTLTDYLASLKGEKGKDAYQSYLETTTDDPKLTEAQWATINATTTQYLYRINKGNTAPMNEQTLSADQLMELDKHRRALIEALKVKGVGALDTDGLEILATKVRELEGNARLTVFKSQQFLDWKEEVFPPLKLSESYRPADLSYLFARNPFLKKLPTVQGIEYATNLSYYALSCTALTEVTLPDLSNAMIVADAFKSCSAIRSMIIGRMPRATDLSRLARECSSLTSATIGATPSATLVHGVFQSCSSLKSVTLDFSGGEITDASYLFHGCVRLSTVTGTLDFTRTTNVGNTFSGCTSLEEVRIKGLKVSLDLSACQSLSMESLRYLVENAQTVKNQSIALSRKLLEAHEEELSELGDTASDKGFTFNYR